jgi:NAD(P)H-flavin reductase
MKRGRENPLMPRRAVVEERIRETGDTCSLKLTLLDDGRYSFNAGQFNMLGVPGYGEAALSFSSLLVGDRSFYHTIRMAGNVTREICRSRAGDTLEVRGPFGNGWPVEKACGRHLIMVAGGIGMAPLRPVVCHVVQNRKKYGRIFILYGARTESDFLYMRELGKWARGDDVVVLRAVDEAPRKVLPDVHVGVVTTLFDMIDVRLQDAVTFTCGPEIMMRFVARQLILKGQMPRDIFVSLERRMKCGIAHCGHCQIGAKYVCKDGPVFPYDAIRRFADTLL